MPFSRTVFLCSLLVSLFAGPVQADFLAAFSTKSGGFNKTDLSLSFLDPVSLEVLSTTELGKFSGFSIATGFGDKEGDFFQVILPPAKGRQPAQLAVFSMESRQEVARLPIGDLHAQKAAGEAGFIELSEDQSTLYILGREKKKWRLDVYERPSHRKISSLDLPKTLASALLLPNGKIALSVKTKNSHQELQLLNTTTGALVAAHEFPRFSELRLIPGDNQKDLVVLATRNVPIDRDPGDLKVIHGDVVDLHRLNVENGEKSEPLKLGYEPTPVNLDEANQFGYFATRQTLSEKGISLWKVDQGQVELLIETDIQANPEFTMVSEKNGVAVVYCGYSAVILDLAGKSLRHAVELPIEALSGFLNSTGQLAYFRETKGSEVGLLDLLDGKVIDAVPTGDKGTKFLQAMSTVAGVAMAGITGYGFFIIRPGTETAMLTDTNEKNLYVINSRTGDVTVLNAASLARIKVLKVTGPMLLSHYEDSPFVYALGWGEVALIDPVTNEIVRNHTNGGFVGANKDKGRIFFSTEHGLQQIDIRTGNVVKTVTSLTQVYSVVDSAPSP